MASKKFFSLTTLILILGILSIATTFFIINEQILRPNPENNKENRTIDLSTKEGSLAVLKDSAESQDYQNFAKYLKIVYERLWDTDKNFMAIESALYMKATEEYFDKGDIQKALEVSSIVFDQVPQGWRFRYLRIRSLEKLGRDAYDQGNLKEAEEYATKILQMMYRPEGANLLADIYIKKIETNIASGDKKTALANLGYIWDYEISSDRRDKLTKLKEQINKLP